MIAGLEPAFAKIGSPGLRELGCAEPGFALAQVVGAEGSAKAAGALTDDSKRVAARLPEIVAVRS